MHFRLARIGTTALVVALAGGCSKDQVKSIDGYCAAVSRHAAALTTPTVSTQGDVDSAVAVYAELHAAAPLAVEPEWAVLEQLMRAAAVADPSDSKAAEDLAIMARRARTAADHVASYTASKCNVSFGLNPTPPSGPPLTGVGQTDSTG